MAVHRFKFNKLVRDKIPAYMISNGINVYERVMEQDEFIKRLKDKLIEEASDVKSALSSEELLDEMVDVLEVLMALAKAAGTNLEQIEQVRATKSEKNGGFGNKAYVSSVEIESNNPLISYYRARPDQYPEIEQD